MILSWKDGVATLIAISIGLFSYFKLQGVHMSFLDNNRIAILLIGLVGVGMCAFGSVTGVTLSTGWNIVLSGLGIGALLLIILGLILGSQLMVLLLSGVILVMWFLTTIRHIIG